MKKHSKIYVAGHTGLVGSALLRALKQKGHTTIVTKTVEELDLRNQQNVIQFFAQEQPEYVIIAAAKVGGIGANYTYPAEFIYDNIMIETNLIHAAYTYQVKKLLFLGSSCIYPRMCNQPIKEEYLLTGPLEPTNEPYALAKIAGIKLCQAYNAQYGTNFISCMPTNLYGPHDNFNIASSHVIPALIAKMVTARETNAPSVDLWGTGKARREFLYVDDLADACLFLMENYNESCPINIGYGNDSTIHELATTIQTIVGYPGNLVYDSSKPDGTPQKLLCSNKLKGYGWKAQTSLDDGLQKTVAWYENYVGNYHISKKDRSHEATL